MNKKSFRDSLTYEGIQDEISYLDYYLQYFHKKHKSPEDYFRHMVLSNYNFRCALTGIDIQQLLLASHIIPWAENKK